MKIVDITAEKITEMANESGIEAYQEDLEYFAMLILNYANIAPNFVGGMTCTNT